MFGEGPAAVKTAFRVVFVNHACFQLETPQSSFLVDPWFSGGIFNDSWRLLEDTDPDRLDLSRLRYLWISHEHPDHFHFPTLRLLRGRVPSPVTAFFRRLPDKSVKNELVKMGYRVVELGDGVPHEVEPGLTIRCYGCGGDSALLVDAGGTMIADTNDCAVSPRQLSRMRRACGGRGVDLLLTQFGLAGYYANPEDAEGLRRAREFHVRQVRGYQKALSARYVVPFASYVYFSRNSNQYLNAAQVRLRDLLDAGLDSGEYFLPRYLEQVWPLPPDPGPVSEANLRHWDEVLGQERPSSDDPIATAADIERYGVAVVGDLKRKVFRRRLGDRTAVFLSDLKRLAVFDWKAATFRLEAADRPSDDAAGEVGSGDFLFLLKFPWGADTLNIASTFRVLRPDHWQWFVWTKHSLYSFDKSRLTARVKHRLLVAANTLSSSVGLDLADGDTRLWRAWDRLRGRS
jgi:hypothetical protein